MCYVHIAYCIYKQQSANKYKVKKTKITRTQQHCPFAHCCIWLLLFSFGWSMCLSRLVRCQCERSEPEPPNAVHAKFAAWHISNAIGSYVATVRLCVCVYVLLLLLLLLSWHISSIHGNGGHTAHMVWSVFNCGIQVAQCALCARDAYRNHHHHYHHHLFNCALVPCVPLHCHCIQHCMWTINTRSGSVKGIK